MKTCLLTFIDDPIRYPADGKTFFTQFEHSLTWALISYILLAEYLMFFLIDQKKSIKTLSSATIILFMPFLFVLEEFLSEFIYCLNNSCGNGYPPTLLSYISGALVGIIPALNIAYLLITLIKKMHSKKGITKISWQDLGWLGVFSKIKGSIEMVEPTQKGTLAKEETSKPSLESREGGEAPTLKILRIFRAGWVQTKTLKKNNQTLKWKQWSK